jgi:hypothetical protein
MNEIRIDLKTLQTYIEETSATSDYYHKGIHYLLISLLQSGAVWRDPAQIVLTIEDMESELNPDLAKKLDDIARRRHN